jgi:hypothetical protein
MKLLLFSGFLLLAGYAIHEFSPHEAETSGQPSNAATQRQLERTQQELNAAANQLARTQNQLNNLSQQAAGTPVATATPQARAASTPPAWFQQRLADESASLSSQPSSGDNTHPPMGGGRRH